MNLYFEKHDYLKRQFAWFSCILYNFILKILMKHLKHCQYKWFY
jgi:hypothetical protein